MCAVGQPVRPGRNALRRLRFEASLQQFGKGGAALHIRALFVAMPAIVDNLYAARVHIADGRLSMLAEYDTRQPRVARMLRDARMVRIEHDEIGARAYPQRADRPARRECAAFQRRSEQAVRDARHIRRREHVALPSRQALAVFEQPQFRAPVDADMAVAADPDASVLIEIIVRGKDAVAEIRFRRQAQACNGPTLRERRGFMCIDMRRMHETPARVDVEAIQQPLHGPRAFRLDAGVHFPRLLGDMDMHGRTRRHRIEPIEQCAQRIVRHGAQRMRRDAVTQRAVLGARAAQRIEQRKQALRRVDEAALIVARRLRTPAY